MEPFFKDELTTLYCADALQNPELWSQGGVLVTDPPYGMNYVSNASKAGSSKPIKGDTTVAARDEMLRIWLGDLKERPALVFGTWRVPRPQCRNTIAWIKGKSPGMGDLKMPWGLSWEEIYVIGRGFTGKRVANHISVPMYSASSKDRPKHPTPKPVELMEELLSKCPEDWLIVDPFAGSGATLLAARNMGRKSIGIELDEEYCQLIVGRIKGNDS